MELFALSPLVNFGSVKLINQSITVGRIKTTLRKVCLDVSLQKNRLKIMYIEHVLILYIKFKWKKKI